MKPASMLSLALVLAATSTFGQLQTSGSQVGRANCPLYMEVTFSGLSQELSIRNDLGNIDPNITVAPGVQQRIDLSVQNPMSFGIEKVEITVHGFSHEARFIPLASDKPDLAKTIDVDLKVPGNTSSTNIAPNASATANLPLPHFAAVSFVELDSITYADGHTWTAGSPKSCGVAPGLMRIN